MYEKLLIGVILVFVVIIVGTVLSMLGGSVSLDPKRKKYNYHVVFFMKNGSNFEFNFYSNSNKKKRDYILEKFVCVNESEFMVEDEQYNQSYYSLSEVSKMEFSVRPTKRYSNSTNGNSKKVSGKKVQTELEKLLSNENEPNQEHETIMKSELSKIEEINDEGSSKKDTEGISNQIQSSIKESDKTVKNVPKELLNEDMVLHKENESNPIEKPYENKFEVPEKKKFFKEFKRAKSSSKRDPFKPKKAIRTKSAGILFLIALLLLSLSGVFGFINSKATSSELRSVKTSIDKKSNSLEVVEKETLSIPLTAAYIEPFVTQYMTISDDFEENQKRNDSLKKYLAFNYDFEKSTSDKRVLKSQEIYNIQENEKSYVVQVKVQYGVGNSDSKNSKTTNEGLISKEALLNIPVIFEKGKFTIIDLPYFSNFDNLQLNKAIELPSNIEGANTITVEEATKIDKFIDQFLTKYATGKKEDLAYMMQYPETLNGLYEFKESTNKIFIKDEKFHILALVIFRDSSSSIEHSENMKLEIVLKDGKYFVEKLDHNLGGIK